MMLITTVLFPLQQKCSSKVVRFLLPISKGAGSGVTISVKPGT